ncbi:RsmD family RNA methyltransferase [Candidatus Saccharibacteria bacterium]|nr:RsmD family RNA methyltransferase [Candidatus Saccharibacteria bacterium]
MVKSAEPKFGGYVRISGGEYKGRKIRTPGEGTHPMGERERIALFNMISNYIPGATVLDLYCGGGTLGIEAISRGAAADFAIDIDRHAVLTAAANMVELGIFEISASALQGDAVEIALKPSEGATRHFDIVFADPPYDLYREEMAKGLPNLVKKGGILVLSHPGDAPVLQGMELIKTRAYAKAHISIYSKS